MGGERVRQGLKLPFIKFPAGLIRIRLYLIDRQLPLGAVLGNFFREITQQSPQSLAETFVRCHYITSLNQLTVDS